ncbi:hypothetical protein OESDEN_16662 [Oesophagostomum dentatum]|uniref:Uncharacterized protein n=1 Tax=Oesophagostomum dentatum TaxID=61180 RepID=A0A0B1SJH9_OESDE|nr:hypothetical protein OESDEN_16662 [Oesophagostomum dentatum]
MLAVILFCAAALLHPALSDNSTDIENDPVVLTISPKIWNLLESKAALINAAATTITFDGFSGKEKWVKYTVSGGRIEQFSIPKWGVSFYDMNNGIHVNVSC